MFFGLMRFEKVSDMRFYQGVAENLAKTTNFNYFKMHQTKKQVETKFLRKLIFMPEKSFLIQ